MTTTPNDLLRLAREAVAAKAERDKVELSTGRFRANEARRAWWAKQEPYEQAVKDPAVIVALCERIEDLELDLEAARDQ